MPNYNVFTNLNSPLTTVDIAASAAEIGANYRVTTGVVSVAPNAFLAIQLSNPTTSRYTARIGRIFGGALTNTSLFLLRNGTVAGGTTLQAVNTNFGYQNTAQLIPTFSTSLTNPVVGGVTFSSLIQTGGPLVDDELGKVIVPPNNRLIIDLLNLTNQTNTLAITVGWAELSPQSN
ncbi:hypothetical protein AM506_20830 [Rossellomorea vietnamensis]|uniref:Uncharacterized protein n=2 Tax=Rossellomorea vietnamensis TaxID=218284 RepID=A0A0P6WIT7_9BACI|nr:hypothetical protein AM506_20830 [Rossellomorea vietnamensis]